MSYRHGQSQPQLGATFYPGGVDDFYMPELISPAPQRCVILLAFLCSAAALLEFFAARVSCADVWLQRIMPEVPENIQENLAYLELEGNSTDRLSGLQSPQPIDRIHHATESTYPSRLSSLSTMQLANGQQQNVDTRTGNWERGNDNMSRLKTRTGYGAQETMHLQTYGLQDRPNFSPFPQLRNRPSNVPPSDDENETILESARLAVLNSNDPEMQLTWAQDALSYVEFAGNEAMRTSENQAPRSQTPRVEHQLRVDAMNVVSFLAEQHHPKAEFMKGMWLEFGKFGYRMDKKEAYRSYTRAAQNGYGRAEYRIGMQFESSNDIAKAIKHYTLGVEARDSASHYVSAVLSLTRNLDWNGCSYCPVVC